MRRLFIILLFLVVSVWLGIEITRHPGYLLVVYESWVIQMPLWFVILSIVLILGLFYLIINSIDRIGFLFYRIKNWLNIRREHKSYSKTQEGLSALIEGRWKKSEKLLLAGMNQSFEPLINYLAAAKAAQEQGAYDRRDKYIQKAYESAPDADLAIGLTQAQLEMAQGQFEQAAATLNHLRQKSPRHPQVLKLLENIYVNLGDWRRLQELYPAMRKAKIFSGDQAERFEKNLYCKMLQDAGKKDLVTVRQVWEETPRYLRKNPDVVTEYVKQLIIFSEIKEVETLIQKTLKTHWQPELVRIYGTLPLTNLNRHLVIAGAWLKMYGQQPETLLLLGKLCVRIQLWGKAKDYFEKCLACGPNAEASLEYGKLLVHLGEDQEAMKKYQQGLSQVTTNIIPDPA